jgi:gliding motility-associated-like protein
MGYTTNPLNIASGFNEPIDVAVDASGNIYVADYANGKVKKLPVAGGTPITIASGLGAIGIAVDASKNVYVTDANNNKVKKIPAGGGQPIAIASGFLLGSIAVDSTGNVYYISGGDGSLTKIPKNGGAPVKILTGQFELGGMAVDVAGNIYVINGSSSAIEKIPAGGGKPVIIASGFSQPGSLAIDAAGNIYVTDGGNGIKKIAAGSNVAVTISPISDAGGLAVDARGNVYTAEFIYNTVRKIKPVGGYYLSRPLPSGLNFSTVDGTISGTPTSPSPATNYAITAYNSGGSKSDVVNITVLSSNANLSNLKLSSGALNPVFSSGTTNYAASVSNATSSIKVTPTASSAFATIKVNGTLTSSGTASAGIPLSVGVNTITTVVNAQSDANRIYTIRVTRRAPGSLDAEDFNPSADSLLTADDGVIVRQALSPNGDGINDVLVIDKINAYPDNELTIINANGIKVFDIKGYDNSSRFFDGHSNLTGVMQQAGTYFYSIDYYVNGINKHKTGYFILKY